MWNTVVSRGRWSAFALALALPGCTAISDCKYEVDQKIRTYQAWHEFDGCNEECFSIDYRCGWKAGYYDVITGGTGCPPVFAPKRYWHPPVLFEHDPTRRNEWYCGFQDGAACAKCTPDHHYLQTFLPGPACCPGGIPTVPAEPNEFPVEHFESAPPTDPMIESSPDAAAAPSTEAGPAADQPQQTPGAAAPGAADSGMPQGLKPGESDYDKDPGQKPAGEPTTKKALPANVISSGQVVSEADQKTRIPSLLDQLVMNAALEAGEEN